jgi:hypothetical protein
LSSTPGGRAAHEQRLIMGAMRAEMRRRGWRLPQLPDDVADAADALAAVLAPDHNGLPLPPEAPR